MGEDPTLSKLDGLASLLVLLQDLHTGGPGGGAHTPAVVARPVAHQHPVVVTGVDLSKGRQVCHSGVRSVTVVSGLSQWCQVYHSNLFRSVTVVPGLSQWCQVCHSGARSVTVVSGLSQWCQVLRSVTAVSGLSQWCQVCLSGVWSVTVVSGSPQVCHSGVRSATVVSDLS